MDVFKFDEENPIIDSFLSEIGSSKLIDNSVWKFLKKVSNPKYIELNQKLQILKPFNKNLPDDRVDDSNGWLPPPLSIIPPFTPDHLYCLLHQFSTLLFCLMCLNLNQIFLSCKTNQLLNSSSKYILA